MGRGNQIIRTLDGDNVKTFYFDSMPSFEDTKAGEIEFMRGQVVEQLVGLSFAMRRRKLEQLMLGGEYPITVTDERVYEEQSRASDDEIDNIRYEVASVEGFERVKDESHGELVAGYNDYGEVIARSKNTMVVIADNENSVAIGCVPDFTRESIAEDYNQDDYNDEAEAELIQTRKRADAHYEIDQSDINQAASVMMDDDIDKAFAARIELYKAEANLVMRKVHEFFGTQSIRVRNGAWMSYTLPVAEKYNGRYYE